MAKTLLYERLDELALLVHGESAPSDQEWDQWVRVLEEWTPHVKGLVVVTDEAGPNGAQRARLNPVVEKVGAIPTAVLTHSRVARGIVTVLSWFNPAIHAYRPDEIAAALNVLGVASTRRDEVLGRVTEMRLRLSMSEPDVEMPPALSDTVAKMEALLKHRLPKLRQEIERRRASRS